MLLLSVLCHCKLNLCGFWMCVMPVQVLLCFDSLINERKLVLKCIYVQCPFSNFQKNVCESFSKLPSSSASLHLLRTALFTHYARTERRWSRCNTQSYNFSFTYLLFEGAVFPACTVCRVFVTKRIVPVLSSDCSQTHTCERVTFHLNINLPTEISTHTDTRRFL